MVHHPEVFHELHKELREAESTWPSYAFVTQEDWRRPEFLHDCAFICFIEFPNDPAQTRYGVLAPCKRECQAPFECYKRLAGRAWSFLPQRWRISESTLDPALEYEPYQFWTDLLSFVNYRDNQGVEGVGGRTFAVNPFRLSARFIEFYRLTSDSPVFPDKSPEKPQQTQPHADEFKAELDSVPQDVGPEVWPPDAGWHFRPGEFAVQGTAHPLSGILWDLLKHFVEARGPVLETDLQDSVWAESGAGPSGIRSQISNLRKELRKAIGLRRDFDPIPLVDKTPRRSWKLNDSLRPGA